MHLKKIYYVPRTISLLIVPFLLTHFIHTHKPKEAFSLKLFLPRDDPYYKKDSSLFSGQEFMEKIKSLKKTEVYLDGDSLLINQKLDFIFHEMQRISFSNKNKEVLVVHMNKENNCGDFVKILDNANCTGIKRYAFWGNEWYFIGNNPPLPPNQEVQLLICGCCDSQIITPIPNLLESIKTGYTKLKENKGLYLIIGWTILILVSFDRRKYL